MSALDKSTVSLSELGVAVDEEALKQTVAECFAETMGVVLQTDALTAGELETGRSWKRRNMAVSPGMPTESLGERNHRKCLYP